MKMIKEILAPLKQLDGEHKRNLIFFICSYFLILFNYSILKSSTTALFLQAYGGKSSPLLWLYTLFALSGVIGVSGALQNKLGIQKLFSIISFVTVIITVFSLIAARMQISWAYYALNIWREIYIVLLVHLSLAYSNHYFSYGEARSFFGLIGAVGSLGGVFGGLFNSFFSSQYGVEMTVGVATFLLLLNIFPFSRTIPIKDFKREPIDEKKPNPLTSIREVREYVFLICICIALSQFVINIANLKFDLMFTELVPDKDQKSIYLGHLNTGINLLSLLIQLSFPWIMQKFSNKKLHFFIPMFYLLLGIPVMFGAGLGSFGIAFVFMAMKGTDYSLFSVIKEFLYYPLRPLQKYGAKYLADMLTYRMAKGLIAFVLIYLQSEAVLNMLMLSFLLLWPLVVGRIFVLQKKMPPLIT